MWWNYGFVCCDNEHKSIAMFLLILACICNQVILPSLLQIVYNIEIYVCYVHPPYSFGWNCVYTWIQAKQNMHPLLTLISVWTAASPLVVMIFPPLACQFSDLLLWYMHSWTCLCVDACVPMNITGPRGCFKGSFKKYCCISCLQNPTIYHSPI